MRTALDVSCWSPHTHVSTRTCTHTCKHAYTHRHNQGNLQKKEQQDETSLSGKYRAERGNCKWREFLNSQSLPLLTHSLHQDTPQSSPNRTSSRNQVLETMVTFLIQATPSLQLPPLSTHLHRECCAGLKGYVLF